MVTDDRPLQPEKVPLTIEVTEFGIVTVVRRVSHAVKVVIVLSL